MPNQATTWLSPTQVNPDTTGFQGNQRIVGLSNGNILVAYSDDSPVGPSGGRDVVGVIYNARGDIVVPAFQLNVQFVADNEQAPTIAATNDGGFYVVYEDTNASGTSLRVTRYDAAGNDTATTTVLSDAGSEVLNNPVIAVDLSDNSFLVTYEYHDAGTDQIRSRAFDANLNFVVQRILAADEDPTDTQLDGDPSRQDTAALLNGGYVTVFDEGDDFNGTNEQTVEFRLTRPNGTRGIVVEVSADDGFDATQARVATLSDGGFVVVWREDSHSDTFGDTSAIRARVYEEDGTARTGVLNVLSSAAPDLARPDVVGLSNGTFVVAWQDNAAAAIVARTFDNNGDTPLSNYTHIQVGDSPQAVDLGTTTDGRILATWQTNSPGNDVQFMILESRNPGTITALPGQGQVTAHAAGSVLVGSTDAEVLYGSAHADVIQFVEASIPAGVDTVDGGLGSDTFEVTALTTQSLITLDLHKFMEGSIVDGAVTYGNTIAELDSIENVIVRGQQDVIGSLLDNIIQATGDFSNDLRGLPGNDFIDAGAYNDVLIGDSGNDTLVGGTGADTMEGGTGDDEYEVGTGGDVTVELDGEGTDTVVSLISLTLADFIENLILDESGVGVAGNGNTLNNHITGNYRDNVLQGYEGNDTLIGGTGDDELRGSSGNDSMEGGTGSDRYFVNEAGDIVNENGGDGITGGNDTVYVQLTYAMTSGVEIMRMQATADIDGIGNELNNRMIGNAGANNLEGGAGDDRLEGGAGADTLAGGEGNDTLTAGGSPDVFKFETVDAGVDTIVDFSRNYDRFDLSGGTFTALTTALNGDAVLTHDGGSIRVQTPPNLTLAEWNALVLPSPLRAHLPIAFEGIDDATSAGAMIAGAHGDWVFA